jgi:DNA adenine methylase
MGGVFFRRRDRVRNEVINDAAGDVVNLFRIIRQHPEALIAEASQQLASREDFDRLCRVPADTLTDIQRALRFYWLQRLGYGGCVRSRSFPTRPTQPKGIRPETMAKHLQAAHHRLAGVTIEHLGYAEFIRRYDRQQTLMYLDPPYYGVEDYYGKELFERADFERLAELLGTLKGRFLLSLNDHPQVRRIFGRFEIDTIPVRYSVKNTSTTELIITNA